MLSKKRIIESVYKRLLFEASLVSSENLAAFVSENSHSFKKISFYDPQAFLSSLVNGKNALEAALEAARGYITVRRPLNSCAGAWNVDSAWGPGLGKILYTSVASLTPNGKLMPDRLSVSPAAGDAWERASWDLPYQYLDDRSHRSCTPTTHTEDPIDDCQVHNEPERPWLDRAYDYSKEIAGASARLRAMTLAHEECLANAANNLLSRMDSGEMPTDPESKEEELEWAIRKACWQKFTDTME